MTVLENMMLALQNQLGESVTYSVVPGLRSRVQQQETDMRDRVWETLEFFEIDHLAGENASNLSGGRRKLLEISRALLADPGMMLLDEPFAGVNPTLERKILDRLHDLLDDGLTFLLVEHDIDLIMDHCDRVIVMHQGDILVEGSPEDVRNDEQVIEAYLGGCRRRRRLHCYSHTPPEALRLRQRGLSVRPVAWMDLSPRPDTPVTKHPQIKMRFGRGPSSAASRADTRDNGPYRTDCCDSIPPCCRNSSARALDTPCLSASPENTHSSPYQSSATTSVSPRAIRRSIASTIATTEAWVMSESDALTVTVSSPRDISTSTVTTASVPPVMASTW